MTCDDIRPREHYANNTSAICVEAGTCDKDGSGRICDRGGRNV